MEYKVEPRSGYVEVVAWGKAKAEVFFEMHDAVFAHPSWKPHSRILSDNQALDASGLKASDIEAIARQSALRSDNFRQCRLAICVAGDLDFGLARMWEALSNSYLQIHSKVFRCRDEAIAWLQQPME